MKFPRMPIEAEAPEQLGYESIRSNLTESSVRDRSLDELGVEVGSLALCYSEHRGHPGLRALVAEAAGAPVAADDVLLAAGASSALFMVAVALLDRGSHMIVWCVRTTARISRRRAAWAARSSWSTSASRTATRSTPRASARLTGTEVVKAP